MTLVTDLSGAEAARERRRKLEEDVERFLAGGGKVTPVTGSAENLQLEQYQSGFALRHRYADKDMVKRMQRTARTPARRVESAPIPDVWPVLRDGSNDEGAPWFNDEELAGLTPTETFFTKFPGGLDTDT